MAILSKTYCAEPAHRCDDAVGCWEDGAPAALLRYFARIASFERSTDASKAAKPSTLRSGASAGWWSERARDGESGAYAYTPGAIPSRCLRRSRLAITNCVRDRASHATLASAPIRITPGKEAPGFVTVTAMALAAGSAVEIILDASGSMLQRLGSQRRIDIAKQTLTKLTSATLPPERRSRCACLAAKWIRVRRSRDSLARSMRLPWAGKLRSSKRRTTKDADGASLEKVADDLESASGERLVDAAQRRRRDLRRRSAAAIEKRRKAPRKSVSIVGLRSTSEAARLVTGRISAPAVLRCKGRGRPQRGDVAVDAAGVREC